MSPSNERDIRVHPVHTIWIATAMAMSGSSLSHPVKCTRTTPAKTPAVVHTSVRRWRASASSVIERWARAARSITSAQAAFASAARTESVRPRPMSCSSWGFISRGTAVQMMAPEATKMSAPSMPLDRYCAFSCPKLCSRSGLAAE